MANETGDVDQVNMQSEVILSDSGGIEVEDYGGAGEKSGDTNEGSGDDGVAGDDANYDNELKTEENLETEKDLSYETSEMETDLSKDDGIENETMELPREITQFTDEKRNNSIPGIENSKPDNDSIPNIVETVTIDKSSYEKLISEQKRLTDELKRLKERLIAVEDDYTSEILELEDRESKARNELNQALETIGQLKNCIREVDQPTNWSERMEQLKSERDAALDDVSKLDDKVHRLTASVTNLQLVIEQIQKENEKKVSSLTRQHLAALESERMIQNDLRQEVEMYEKKSMESAQALEAATRLTENIDKKEEIIQNLKQELCDKEKQISNLEVDKANLKASFEGKVDKQVIKNLILGYFGTPNDKKHEVERLLARVLDFNEQEMIRAGLSFGRPTTVTSAGSILLAPLQTSTTTTTSSTGYHHHSSSSSIDVSSTSSYTNEPTTGTSGSLSKMFVEFLEAESRPKGKPINVHPTSSLTRELARDLTKAALTPHNKPHLLLEPTITMGTSKVSPVPNVSTSSSLFSSNTLGLQQSQSQPQQSIGNHISQSNIRPSANPLIVSTSSQLAANKISLPFSGNLNSNPIRPITINSSNNIITEIDSSITSIGSMSTPHQQQQQQQHQKSSSLSSISSSSSSSSLILSNPMPSFTNTIKPITFDANNHTHQPPLQQLSSSSLTIINPTITSTTKLTPQSSIAQQHQHQHQQSSLSSHSLLSEANTSNLRPSHSSSSLITSYLPSSSLTPSTSNTISSLAPTSSLLLPAPSSDYNSILSNSHLKVKK